MRALRAVVLVMLGLVLGGGFYVLVYEVSGTDQIPYASMMLALLIVGSWVYRELGK